MGGEFQNRLHLVPRESIENFDNLINGQTVFQVFENSRHRDPRSSKDPSSADSSRHALHGIAL
jgi:hypothetical protein